MPGHRLVFHEQERRVALHDEALAVTLLYGGSALLGVYSVVVGAISLAGNGGPACAPGATSCEDAQRVAWIVSVSGIAAAVTGCVLMLVGIGLDVDRRSGQRALDREAGHVRLAPGPGEIGLALSITLDG